MNHQKTPVKRLELWVDKNKHLRLQNITNSSYANAALPSLGISAAFITRALVAATGTALLELPCVFAISFRFLLL